MFTSAYVTSVHPDGHIMVAIDTCMARVASFLAVVLLLMLASASSGKFANVKSMLKVAMTGAGVGGGVGLVPSLTVTVVAHPCKTNRPAQKSAANVHPRIASADKPGDVFQAILEPRL